MDIDTPQHFTIDSFLARLQATLTSTDALAYVWDREALFVDEGLAALRQSGAMHAPLPPDLGGLGLGTSSAGARAILETLRLIGRHHLSLGRIYEGHVNALRLILRYGSQMQAWHAAQDARAGHLFAVWAAEVRDTRVRLIDGILQGHKAFASAARQTTRALVTADVPDEGECLILVQLRPGQRRDGTCFELHGMRSAGTAPVDFTDLPAAPDSRIGRPGDYMREPEISLGAWRTLAVQLGGLETLVELVGQDLTARRRAGDPHQLARFGNILVAQGTARLWVERAAMLAESEDADQAAADEIKLARIAVEAACVDVIAATERAVGLAAFVRPNPIERVMRDLSTYLRQPALDIVRDEAASAYLSRGVG